MGKLFHDHKKPLGGFIAIVEPSKASLNVAVIEIGENKYALVITDHFLIINDKVVDVWDYEIIDDTFTDVEEAISFLPVAAMCVDRNIRKIIEDAGGTVGRTEVIK